MEKPRETPLLKKHLAPKNIQPNVLPYILCRFIKKYCSHYIFRMRNYIRVLLDETLQLGHEKDGVAGRSSVS